MAQAAVAVNIAEEWAGAVEAATNDPIKAGEAYERAVDQMLIRTGATKASCEYPAVPERYLRSEQRTHELSLESVFEISTDALPQGSDVVLAMTAARLVRLVLNTRLSERQSIVTFCFYEGWNQRDTAERANCSQATVSLELKAAFRVLQKALPTDPYWNIAELLLEVFGRRGLSLGNRA